MSDFTTRRYETYFSVLIFHHYFLDDGAKVFVFNNRAEQPELSKQPELSEYDVRTFFNIEATAATKQLLQNHRAIVRTTALGFVVLVPEGTQLAENLFFNLVVTDPLFNNYTSLTLKLPTVETYQQLEDGLIRTFKIKHNVFELTNAGKISLSLSNDIPIRNNDDFVVDELFMEGGKLYQAVQDGAGIDFRKEIAPPSAGVLPVFLNQSDIPTTPVDFVTPTEAADGSTIWTSNRKTIKGIHLSDDVPMQVFAIIKIDPSTVHFGTPSPSFELHLKSRGTYWHYFNKADGKYKAESPDFWLPLTLRGKQNIKRKATPDVIKIERDNAGKITKLISEINP